MNKIVTIILILVIIALVGFSYYLYSGVTKCQVVATDLGTSLQQCGTSLQQCGTGVTTCQGALNALRQIPACAAYIPAQ